MPQVCYIRKNQPNSEFVQNFTYSLRDTVRLAKNKFLLNQLAFTDIRANELFYHVDYLKTLENKYTKSSKVANEDNSQTWIKALAFNKVVDHIYDCTAEFSGVIVSVKHLKKMYIDELNSKGICITSHVTSFSIRLTNLIYGLFAKRSGQINELGIFLSYTLILEITKFIYEKLILSHELHDAFLPRVLKNCVFAKDNIEKNASSTLAILLYHGTNISVLQFLTQGEIGLELQQLQSQVKPHHVCFHKLIF